MSSTYPDQIISICLYQRTRLHKFREKETQNWTFKTFEVNIKLIMDISSDVRYSVLREKNSDWQPDNEIELSTDAVYSSTITTTPRIPVFSTTTTTPVQSTSSSSSSSSSTSSAAVVAAAAPDRRRKLPDNSEMEPIGQQREEEHFDAHDVSAGDVEKRNASARMSASGANSKMNATAQIPG